MLLLDGFILDFDWSSLHNLSLDFGAEAYDAFGIEQGKHKKGSLMQAALVAQEDSRTRRC
jgi:hypothetical protein